MDKKPTKNNHTKIIAVDIPDIDKEIILLCDVLNSFEGVMTVSSCCGHGEDSFRVWVVADYSYDGSDALQFLGWAINTEMARDGDIKVNISLGSGDDWFYFRNVIECMISGDGIPDKVAQRLKELKEQCYDPYYDSEAEETGGSLKMDFEEELIDELRQIKYYLKAVALTRIEELWGHETDENISKNMAKGAVSEALDIEHPEFALEIEAERIEADRIEAERIEAERIKDEGKKKAK